MTSKKKSAAKKPARRGGKTAVKKKAAPKKKVATKKKASPVRKAVPKKKVVAKKATPKKKVVAKKKVVSKKNVASKRKSIAKKVAVPKKKGSSKKAEVAKKKSLPKKAVAAAKKSEIKKSIPTQAISDSAIKKENDVVSEVQKETIRKNIAERIETPEVVPKLVEQTAIPFPTTETKPDEGVKGILNKSKRLAPARNHDPHHIKLNNVKKGGPKPSGKKPLW